MAKAKPILDGVSDFVRMRTEGAYYIDRTAYIRELEKTRYVMFLRPRRFGLKIGAIGFKVRFGWTAH